MPTTQNAPSPGTSLSWRWGECIETGDPRYCECCKDRETQFINDVNSLLDAPLQAMPWWRLTDSSDNVTLLHQVTSGTDLLDKVLIGDSILRAEIALGAGGESITASLTTDDPLSNVVEFRCIPIPEEHTELLDLLAVDLRASDTLGLITQDVIDRRLHLGTPHESIRSAVQLQGALVEARQWGLCPDLDESIDAATATGPWDPDFIQALAQMLQLLDSRDITRAAAILRSASA